MSVSYQDLLLPFFKQVAEEQIPYHFLSERHVQVMWLEQKYFKDLYTSDGEKIVVLSPGIWNTEAGPDFLKAHLYIGTKEWRGDIEIHLNDGGWYQHSHHENERYNQVILHLSFWRPKIRRSLFKKDGKELTKAYLEDVLNVSIDHLIQLIDLDLYPYKQFSGHGQCAERLFKSLSNEQISTFFASAAQWRLEEKKNYLKMRFTAPSLQLAGGIAMALGYKNNTESFLELFIYLFSYRDYPPDLLLAIGLGCCGFFDNKIKEQWKLSLYYQKLQQLWWGEKNQITHQTQLKLDRIRPLNHPIRRLVYMVKLLSDSQAKLESIWDQLYRVWNQFILDGKQSKKDFIYLQQKLMNFIPFYQDEYWNHHYTFESKKQKIYLPLIGEDLKTEILINTFFPLLYSKIKEQGDISQWETLSIFYETFKAAYTKKSRYLANRFFGNTTKVNLLNKRQMEQGAYQLHKDFCTHFESSCEGCPFVERYIARFKKMIC